MFKVAAMITITILMSAQMATAKIINGLTKQETSKFKIYQTEQLFGLVDKYDSVTNTNLKMKVTTYNLGGSTDTANMTQVLLSSFCYNEMKQGGASHLIANVDKVLSVTREDAGIYKVVVQEWPIGDNWPTPWPDFRVHKVVYMVYAADLSVELRQLAGIEEFGQRHYTSPIKVTRQVLD